MLVRWLTPAKKDMLQLVDWYEHNAPEALSAVAQGIWDAAQSLDRLPYRGRPGLVDGTRELLISKLPYMLVYVVQGDEVSILRLLHQHQNWPD